MGRRYLLRDEAQAALARGRTVECFLGACERRGKPGIRRVALSLEGGVVVERLYETADLGGPEFLDLYGFGPLDPDLGQDEADEVATYANLDDCLASMSQRWPGSDERLTNEGVVQDEYADYLANRSH